MPTKEEQKQLRAIKALTTVMEAFMKSHPDLANIVVEDLSFSTLPAPDAVAAESDMRYTEGGTKNFIARRRPIVLGDYSASQGGGGTTIFRPKPKPPR